MAQLNVRDSGDSSGEIREIDLGSGILSIGRSEAADILLDNQTVSRNHATLCATSQGFVLEDRGSSNGTWVNGLRIERKLLQHEDKIRFGKAVAVFDEPPNPAATLRINVRGILDEIQGTARMDVSAQLRAASRPPALPMPPLDEFLPTTAPDSDISAAHRAPPVLPPVLRSGEALQPSRTGPHFAGFWIRLLAWVIDALILGIVLGGLSAGLSLAVGVLASGNPRLQAFLVPVLAGIACLLSVLYILIMWVLFGRTIGKAACRIRILRENGGSLGCSGAIVRLFGCVLNTLSLGTGFLMVAVTDRKRGLHDMVAGTVVVHDG